MKNSVTFQYSININTAQEIAFEYIMDWDKQSEWIAFTTVKKTSDANNRIGANLSARTGLGPIGFVDTMTITEWSPPNICKVEHTGKLVKGTGEFIFNKLSDTESEFIWKEVSPIPLGMLGKLGFMIIKPLIDYMFNRSLSNLKSNLEKLNPTG